MNHYIVFLLLFFETCWGTLRTQIGNIKKHHMNLLRTRWEHIGAKAWLGVSKVAFESP
jgi:hypothetical protein